VLLLLQLRLRVRTHDASIKPAAGADPSQSLCALELERSGQHSRRNEACGTMLHGVVRS
jgi:hypothetical protein